MTNALIERIYTNPDIYKINVPLPKNPLRNLNCYVIKTPEKNLIIDTGFNLPESKQALLSGLAELAVDMAKTDIYATHLHADHTGLIGEIKQDATVIYMNPTDYAMTIDYMSTFWPEMEASMLENGFPPEELEANRASNPALNYITGKPFSIQPVKDGDMIPVGPYQLTVIDVPGHTPGNTCLYMEKEKILFSGDHILFDISPNITAWPGMANALGSYLDSLRKISRLDIRLTLPAHRQNDMDVYERIRQIFAHHEKRLQNTEEILQAYPNSSAYEVASHMQWSMRGKSWAQSPIYQKWFAVGETRSHLDYLIAAGKVDKKTAEGINRYHITVT